MGGLGTSHLGFAVRAMLFGGGRAAAPYSGESRISAEATFKQSTSATNRDHTFRRGVFSDPRRSPSSAGS